MVAKTLKLWSLRLFLAIAFLVAVFITSFVWHLGADIMWRWAT
jgi:hypothetical protein